MLDPHLDLGITSEKSPANILKMELYKAVYQLYQGLPLAMALFSHINVHNLHQWESVRKIIQNNDHLDYHKSIINESMHILISCAVSKLSKEDRELFKLLGVFPRTRIPISMVSILWNYPEEEVYKKLELLKNRSLLTCFKQIDHSNKLR